MKERGFGHVVNVSSIGVQTNPPRFSAYVASKAALDAFTRVVSSETIGDNITFTTIHMPLVRTPMIAPTKLYDSFPTISPDEAADLICEAIRAKPKQINTRLGTFGEVLYALAPKAVDQILHMAYNVFPESAAASGQEGRERARLGRGGRAVAPDEGRALVVACCCASPTLTSATRPCACTPTCPRSSTSARARSGRSTSAARAGRSRLEYELELVHADGGSEWVLRPGQPAARARRVRREVRAAAGGLRAAGVARRAAGRGRRARARRARPRARHATSPCGSGARRTPRTASRCRCSSPTTGPSTPSWPG